MWSFWKDYKNQQHKFTYKSILTEQAALKKLAELSQNNEETAISMIERSISNGWKGIFELNNNNNGKGKVIAEAESWKRVFDRRQREREEFAANGEKR